MRHSALSTLLASLFVMSLAACGDSDGAHAPPDGDAPAGEGEGEGGGEGEGEGEVGKGEVGEGEGEGGEGEGGEGEGEGETGEGEGEEGEGEGPSPCENDADRRCAVSCVIGSQTCDEGVWTACEGRLDCDDRRCAERFVDACSEVAAEGDVPGPGVPDRPACEEEARRPCRNGCLQGVAFCVEGEWSRCNVEHVDCRDPACAERHPEECNADRVCEPGDVVGCGDDCARGESRCIEGEWGECRVRAIACRVPECAEAHPDECGEPDSPVDCQPGERQDCRTRCEVGQQACVDGFWSPCHGRVDCQDSDCAARYERECAAPPAGCENGARRECERGCIEGHQVCERGDWLPCRGRVRCEDAACLDLHADACEEQCAPGSVRRCDEGCFAGIEECGREGWGRCVLEHIDCRDPRCAEHHPRECGGGEEPEHECRRGEEAPCSRGCHDGVRHCEDGQWGGCRIRALDCDNDGCDAAEVAACDAQPAGCEDGARQACSGHCVEGSQFCRDDRWSVCVGDIDCTDVECAADFPRDCRPVECADGDSERCEARCLVGTRRCVGEHWGDCRGQVNCEDRGCATAHPDSCAVDEAECNRGDARRCERGCFLGTQACERGAWGACDLEHLDCRNDECAADHPDECGNPAECRQGEERRCGDECEIGTSICTRGGIWSECRVRDIDCGLDACAAEPECQDAGCRDGATQACDDGDRCTHGLQTCRARRWSVCRGEINCEHDDCAERHPRECAPPECRAGEVRGCSERCLRGEQRCADGAWTACRGELDCSNDACATAHAEACARPDCRDGDRQRCETRCGEGNQVCLPAGEWGACRVDRPNCEDAGCRELHADRCGPPDGGDDEPECRRGEVQPCRDRCIEGRTSCVGGRWDACEGHVDCANRECAANFPDQCAQPDEAECDPREARPCREGCFAGHEFCEDEHWSGICVPQDVNCQDDECSQHFPEECGGVRPECRDGESRACPDRCIDGDQRCIDGFWGDCRGNIDCAPAACAQRHERICAAPEPECDVAETRPCGRPCIDGTQRCDAGRWGRCVGDPLCDLDICAERAPECIDAECVDGDVEACRDRCITGRHQCRGGQWTSCDGPVDCAVAECSADFPRECDGVDPRPDRPECERGDRRPCPDPCVIHGVQECIAGDGDRGGEWGACRGAGIDCRDDRCVATHPDRCDGGRDQPADADGADGADGRDRPEN